MIEGCVEVTGPMDCVGIGEAGDEMVFAKTGKHFSGAGVIALRPFRKDFEELFRRQIHFELSGDILAEILGRCLAQFKRPHMGALKPHCLKVWDRRSMARDFHQVDKHIVLNQNAAEIKRRGGCMRWP